MPDNPFVAALEQAQSQQLKQDALKHIGHAGMGAVGAGVAGRGLLGLYNLLKTRLSPPDVQHPSYTTIDIPFPEEQEESEEEKTANEQGTLGKFFQGDYASTFGGIPWYYPALTGAVGGGAYMGWKALDKILDKRRKHQLEQEVERAKHDFRSALMSQYEKESSNTLGPELDGLYDHIEKQAISLNPVDWASAAGIDAPDLLGRGVGAYGAGAGLTALTTGMVIYNMMKKRQRKAVLEKAKKERLRRLYESRPPEIYARPVTAQSEVG